MQDLQKWGAWRPNEDVDSKTLDIPLRRGVEETRVVKSPYLHWFRCIGPEHAVRPQ